LDRISGERAAQVDHSVVATMEPAARPARFPLIDALRGAAIASMFAYHFCFDLNYFGKLHQDFNYDPFWLTARSLILGSFVALVGVSLTLATNNGIKWQPYLIRLGWVAACSAVVSMASYQLFPESWIYFGVLHFILVASVLALAFIPLYWANLALGAVLIGIGVFVKSAVFDQPLLGWLGLMSHKPITEDYVLLLPWFGVVLAGMFVGKLVFGKQPWSGVVRWQAAGPIGRLLAWAGKRSLLLYMVHQAIFLACSTC
jgi:uncharacterized membrane protein